MKYLRQRILEPIVIPLLAGLLIIFGVVNLSRLFLAAGGTKAVALAAVVALLILGGATLATSRSEPLNRGTMLGAAALLGLVLSGAGLLAQEVDEEHLAEHGGEEDGQEISSVVGLTAVDIDFTEKEVEASPGTIRFDYVNEGESVHTLVVEGFEDEMKLEVPGNGDTDTGTIELESGEYTFYCDVPGHRSAGMEGTLTVDEGLGTAPAEGEGAAGSGGEPDLAVTAVDIDFTEKQLEAPSGEIGFEYVNEGESVHTLVVEGFEDEMKLEVPGNGDTDTGTIELESGEYTFYCDVPGHRSAGMEGTLTVTEGGGGGGGSPPDDGAAAARHAAPVPPPR